jgi:hypothetical protein
MMQDLLLSTRRNELIDIIKRTFSESQPHSKALAVRILGKQNLLEMGLAQNEFPIIREARYGGYPEIAAQGFMLATKKDAETVDSAKFLVEVKRLKSRSKGQHFVSDDVALLGLAEGITQIALYNTTMQARECRDWLIGITSSTPQTGIWTSRMRTLARNLLDRGNSLQAIDFDSQIDAQALEVTMRDVWQGQFIDVPQLPNSYFENLFTELLRHNPDPTDLEKAVCWLHAIDLIVEHASKALFPRSNKENIAIKNLTAIKMKLDEKGIAQAKAIVWGVVGLLTIFWVILIGLTIAYG